MEAPHQHLFPQIYFHHKSNKFVSTEIMQKRRILKFRLLDDEVFKNCEFLKWFEEVSLKNFIFDIPKEMSQVW